MTSTADMDILKEIPGYKAIMKAVLKTQIQLLVEQLSDHTGEESVVLTASVNDGSLSHLGSITGKGFLEGRDEIKSQFLGYCLKSHHKRKTQEEPAPPYQRSNISHPGPRTAIQPTAKRPRLQAASLSRSGSQGSDLEGNQPSDSGRDAMFTSTPVRGPTQSQKGSSSDNLAGQPRLLPSESPSMKQEQLGAMLGDNDESSDMATDLMAPTTLPSSIGLSHTQTSAGENEQSDKGQTDTGDASQESARIKVEPNTEPELDLEITGVEEGDNSSQMSGENWGQNVTGFGPGGVDDGSFDQSGSQAGYIQLAGKPKTGQQKLSKSDLAATDKSLNQTGGMVHRSNYDGQRYTNMGDLINWRTVGTFERPGTVAQHIQDAFSIKPPAGLPRTVPGINAAQNLALGQTPAYDSPSTGSIPKPQHGQSRIDTQALVPQMSSESTTQPTEKSTVFRKILPKDGPGTQYITKQIDLTVLKNKRPVGRPRKELAANATCINSSQEQAAKLTFGLQQQDMECPMKIIPQARSMIEYNIKPIQVSAKNKKPRGRPPKNLAANVTKSSTNEEPTANQTGSRSHMDLPANLNILSALERKVGRPKTQDAVHAMETPLKVVSMKRKVGRPRKSMQGVYPVSLKKVGSTSDMQLLKTENRPESSMEEKSPIRKNYVEPIDDIIDIDEEATVWENINGSSADTLNEETTDPCKMSENHHAKGPVGRPRKIPKTAIIEVGDKYLANLPSVSSQRQLLKRPRGRPRKNPSGGLIQRRPYFGKALHGIFKRPVGRPRKIKQNTSLAVSKDISSDKGCKQEPKKTLVVLIDDIMKTQRVPLYDPKKDNTDEKACIVNVYESREYIDKEKEDTAKTVKTDDKQLAYREMPDKGTDEEGGCQFLKGHLDSGVNARKRSLVDDDQQQIDKTASLELSQPSSSPKSKVHLPKSMWGEIIEHAKKEGMEAACSLYGIGKSTIYNWRQQLKHSGSGEVHCLNVSSGVGELASQSRVVEKKIVVLETEQEKQIIDWIKEQVQTNNVTAEMIKGHALAVTTPGFEASDEWLRSFIERNNLSVILGI